MTVEPWPNLSQTDSYKYVNSGTILASASRLILIYLCHMVTLSLGNYWITYKKRKGLKFVDSLSIVGLSIQILDCYIFEVDSI